MNEFPKFKQADYPTLYLEDTDQELTKNLDSNIRYAYFKTIAKGGKSLIQSCRDLHLGRVVCHKSLRAEFSQDPIEQRRLLREARISAMLQHPNTMPTYELGRDRKGLCYFTMKLVHGYTFREIINYRERYDLSQLLDIIVQVANALQYAHTHGVVHRDIKPENILVGPFGEVLLLDWGLAKVRSKVGDVSELSDLSEENVVLDPGMTGYQKLQGTLSYMSPEQIRKAPDIDGRTDIFSLMAILYEALCGRTPNSGSTVDGIISSVLNDLPENILDVSSLPLPMTLGDVIMSCLSKDPAYRIQRIDELIRLLRQ